MWYEVPELPGGERAAGGKPRPVADIVQACVALYNRVAINKVKAHATDQDVLLERITPWHMAGNQWADTFAGEAAQRAAVPEHLLRQLDELDERAWTSENV